MAAKSGSVQLKYYLLGLDRNICYDSARSNLELLTFDLGTYFRIF